MARRSIADQWSAGSNYIARGGMQPGQGDSLGLMATSPGLGDTDAWTTGGEVGPDDGMGGGGMGGWAGSDGDGSDYEGSYDASGDDGSDGYTTSDGYDAEDDSDADDSSGGATRSGDAGAEDVPPGNILVGFAVTAGFFVLGAWGLHHLAGAEERRVGDISPSLVTAMKVGGMATLTIPLYRAAIAQLAYWGVPFAADASAYVNGA